MRLVSAPTIQSRIGSVLFLEQFWQRNGFIQTYGDFLLSEIDPLWSPRKLQARVVAIRQETADAKTYVLKPARRWKGFQAGMHLQIGVEARGVSLSRYYSVSSSVQQFEREGTFSITVKRIPQGRMSNWLFDHLQPEDIVRISQASGEFTLEQTQADKLLFLAAGSGITPMMSMLSTHLPQAPERDFQLLYYCCNPDEVIFAQALQALADQYPNFRLDVVHTDTDGLINEQQLASRCADAAAREVFLCGPGGFMQVARELLEAQGVDGSRIHQESFGVRIDVNATEQLGARVLFSKAGVEAEADGGQTILMLAESAGLKPKYGCRTGICHECKCVKKSGAVRNLLTGQISTAENEAIQTCISVPQGIVEVAL